MKKIYLWITGAVAVFLAAIAGWLAVSGLSGKGQGHDDSKDTKSAHKSNTEAAKVKASEAIAEIAAIPDPSDRANLYREFVSAAIRAASKQPDRVK